MNLKRFELLCEEILEKAKQIRLDKGHDYSGNEDRLKNFKDSAARFGMTPLQAWAIFAFKHIDAICTFVQKGQVESEPIEGRFHDAINYFLLGYALIYEEKVVAGDKVQGECR